MGKQAKQNKQKKRLWSKSRQNKRASPGSAVAVMAHEHSGSALKKSDLFEGPRRLRPQVTAVEAD